MLLACAALLVPAAPAAARLAVVTTGKPEVAVVDLGRKQVLARPGVGLPSRGVALSLDGMRAYVVASDGSAGLLSTIELAGNTVVQRIPLPPLARQVALSADGARAYVTAGGGRGKNRGRRSRHRHDRDRLRLAGHPARSRSLPTDARLHDVGARRLAVVDLVAPDAEDAAGRARPPRRRGRAVRHRVYVTNAGAGPCRSRCPTAARRESRALAPAGRRHALSRAVAA